MRRLTVAASLAAALAVAGACNRSTPASDDARQDAAAPATDARERETASLEQRLNELEKEWQQARQRLSDQARRNAPRLTTAIDEDFSAARESLRDLRQSTAQDWWQRQEQQLERAAERAEQSVRTFARDWSPSTKDESVGTAGDANADWSARRDALVTRLEQRVRDMEQALERLDPRDFDHAELEHARERVDLMKEDAERLRGASEDEWWELTKERVRAQLDRLDAAIDRLAQGRV